MPRTLHLDFETKSPADLRKVGAHRYTRDPEFRVLMAAYAFDDEPVRIWDYTEGFMPAELADALYDPAVQKWAHNAAFEMASTAAMALGTVPDPAEWRDTMVWGAYLGLPRSLENLAKHLRLTDQKDSEGKRLIQMFSKPISAGSRKGDWRDPAEFPEEWARYREYCMQDVEVERAIHAKLQARPMPEEEWELWALDQRINFTGMRIDRPLVEQAVRLDAEQVAKRHAHLKNLTGLDNPNSVQQLTGWLESEGVRLPNLLKETVEQYVVDERGNQRVRSALNIRLANASKSTSKYAAMLASTIPGDDRVRGAFQFYGADTGRWAGRLVQFQNLPKNKAKGADLDALRERLRAGDETLPSADLKQLIRTALIPAPGCEFLVADLAAIEARVIAWLAGETWALEAFATHGKIYEATAAAMLGKGIDEVTGDERQRGKVAVLALGYQGAVGALVKMGAISMGLTEEELPALVAQWRRANPAIVKLWAAYEKAARRAAATAQPVTAGRCTFTKARGGALYVTLPSGRALAYPDFKTSTDESGRSRSTYLDTTTRYRIDTYGGKLTENIVQAVARDILARGMLNADLLGYRIVAHVHDEIIVEAPVGGRVNDLIEMMCAAPAWADGLPLAAEGEAQSYYHK